MVLLTPKFLSYTKKGITHGAKYYFHPFVWNKVRNEPELTRSKWRLCLWYLNVLITGIYSIFLLVRSLQVNLDERASNGKKIYMRFIIFFQFFPAMFQVAIYLKKEEFSNFFQMATTFFQGVDGLNGKRRELKMPILFELFFDFLWYFFMLACCGVGVISILRPDAADKISSIFLKKGEAETILTIAIRISCVLFQVYYNVMYCANGCLWLFVIFLVFFPALVVLKEIKNMMKASATISEHQSRRQNQFGFQNRYGPMTREKVQKILRLYKSMEILMKYFHNLCCTIVIPTGKITMMTLTVFCTYGAIKMSGFLPVFLATVGLLATNITVALITSMAWLHTYSEQILFFMKCPQFQRHLDLAGRKYVTALRVVKIRMGSSYFVDKKCVVTCLRILVDRTVDFLLANS